MQQEMEAAYLHGITTDTDLANEIGTSQSYRFLEDQYGSKKDIATATFGIGSGPSPSGALTKLAVL